MAIGNLGRLAVFLDVNMAGFVAGMSTASMQVKGLAATVTRNAGAIKAMGTQFLIAGAAIAAGLGFAVKAAMDFESQMAKVNTMLKASEQYYMPQFSTTLRALAVEFGQSMKTLTEGTYDVLSAQMGAAKAMKFMAIASKSAVGGFTDTKTSVSALLTLMKTFKTQITDVTDASDFLHKVVERGRITFAELASTIGTTAAMASQAGMTVEDFGAAIAILTKGGLDAQKAQTALRGILRSVLKTQEEGIAVGKELGVVWAVDAIRAGNFTKTMLKLSDASIEQLSALAPNIRGLLGFAIAAGNAEESVKDMEAIMRRAGKTEETFELANATLTQQFERLKAAVNNSRIAIGDKLIPVLKDLIKNIIDVTGRITEFADAYPKLFKGTVELTAKLALFSITLGALLILLPKMAAAVKTLGIAIAVLAAIPGWRGILTYLYTMGKVSDITREGIKAIKALNLEKDVEAHRIATLNQNYEVYRELLDDAREGIMLMTTEGLEVPASLRMAVDILEETIKKYKEEKATVEQLTIAFESYIAAKEGIYTVGKKEEEGLIKVISLREKDYESYRKIENLKHKISLLGVDGIESERLAEEYRHIKVIEDLEKEFEKKKDILVILTELENQLHDKRIQDIKDQENMTVQMLKTLESSFQSTFAGTLKGEIASFGDFFDRVLQSMRSKWADLMGEMVVEWIKSRIAMATATGESGSSMFGNILKLVGGVMGLGSVSAATSASAGSLLLQPSGNPLGYAGLTGAGLADGGMISATGLYKLHQGEEVKTRDPGGNSGVTIINAISPDLITAAMASAPGQKIIVNVISQDILKNGITRKTMKGGGA